MSIALNELAILDKLNSSISKNSVEISKNYNYYYQKLVTKDLGISTPPRLRGLNTVLFWGASSVDSIGERLFWRGYWSPEDTTAELTEYLNNIIYRDNHMEVMQKGHQKDAGITGHSFVSLAPGDENAGENHLIVRNESPLNTYGTYNSRSLKLDNALKISNTGDGKEQIATLWLPDSTIILKRQNKSKEWVLHDRDDHELGAVTVVPVINNPDTSNPFGRTEISPSLKGFIDSGMRTLLGAEIAREFMSQPLRALLGADPGAFIDDATGEPIDAWDMIMGKVLQVPYNTNDNIMPQLTSLTAGDPSKVMDLIESYGRLAAREIGIPPSEFGFETVNPSSADAMIEANKKIISKVNDRIPSLKMAYKQVAEYALLLDDIDKPDDWNTMEAVFMRPETPTPAASADRISKMLAGGVFDTKLPTFVYRELGLSEVEIKELQSFLVEQEGNNLVNQLIQANSNIGATQTGA